MIDVVYFLNCLLKTILLSEKRHLNVFEALVAGIHVLPLWERKEQPRSNASSDGAEAREMLHC
jgi:hypothetical protein